jgi:hypothetical protein
MQFKSEYVKADGEPAGCAECQRTDVKLTEKIRDRDEANIFEIEVFCSECGASVGYWAYGYWDPAYSRYIKLFYRR